MLILSKGILMRNPEINQIQNQSGHIQFDNTIISRY